MNDTSEGTNALHISVLQSKLALAFIVKNEGRYALDMLKSIIHIVGFVSCIDTGSTDDTVQIITDYLEMSNISFSVFVTKYFRFDAARNEAIARVPKEFEWIMMLDADEVILDKYYAELANLVDQDLVDAWGIPRYNWVDDIFGIVGNAYPDYQARLFRNYRDSRIHYERPVHEILRGFSKRTNLEAEANRSWEVSGLHIHHLRCRKNPKVWQERHELYGRLKLRMQLLDQLWYGKDPLQSASAFSGKEDLQGWRSDHPYLKLAIDEVLPQIVVEVGVWKGASTITMANRLRDKKISGTVICVDTWLGSWDHWIQPRLFSDLHFENGYPTLYWTFVANVLKADLQSYIVPLPVGSLNAAEILKRKGITPGLIHIDGARDYESVMSDLRVWWPLLSGGGILIGDDYEPNGQSWPEVKKAFEDFFQTASIENAGGKCLIRKKLLPTS